MIQLTFKGADLAGEAEQAAYREAFAQRHLVVFKRFVDRAVLEWVPQLLSDADFYTREDIDGKGATYGRELTLRQRSPLSKLLHILLNRERILTAMEPFADGRRIRCFIGRGYKVLANSGHYDSWHPDTVHGRLLGLSINLSEAPFAGGRLQLRRCRSSELHEAPAMEFGDALLFRIDPEFEHRILPVTGAAPKCSFAGWFGQKHDFRDLVQVQRMA